MPLRIPDKLPAIELLKHENIFVMDESRAHKQEIRPLKICEIGRASCRERVYVLV